LLCRCAPRSLYFRVQLTCGARNTTILHPIWKVLARTGCRLSEFGFLSRSHSFQLRLLLLCHSLCRIRKTHGR